MTTYETVLLICTIVWIAGMLGFLIYGIVNDLKIRSRVKKAIRDEKNVYCCDEISSPFLFGIFRPRIYIPFGLEENEKSYILAHEKYHLKRKDHIIKLIAYFTLMVHWFNPLVWIGFILMNKDLEMSCDEKILSQNQGIKKAYSTSLLSFATGKKMTSPISLSFGESSVKERVKNTLKWRKPKLWLSVIAVILCFATLVACMSNPGKKADDTTKPESKKAEDTNKEAETKKAEGAVARYTTEVCTYADGSKDTIKYQYDSNANVVKKIEDTSYGDQYVTTYDYDINGNVIKEIINDPDGNQSITEYEYDEKGNLISEVTNCPAMSDDVTYYEYDEKGNMIRAGEASFQYDNKGNIIQASRYNENTGFFDIYRYEYEYFDDGNTVKKANETYYECSLFQYEYDENGNKVKKLYLNDPDSEQTYEYDKNGNLIKEIFKDYDENQKIYEYDGKGNTIRYIFIDEGGDQSIKEFEYDEKGRIIKSYDWLYTYQYEYNDTENKVKETRISSDGSIDRVIDWDLDEQGRMTKGKVLYYVAANSSRYNECYFEKEYDSNGNLIREMYPSTYFKCMIESIYEYNEHGDVICIVDCWEDQAYSSCTEFDKNGNPIKMVKTYQGGKQVITEWKYEYDERGNLIKKTEIIDGKFNCSYEYLDYVYFSSVIDAE